MNSDLQAANGQLLEADALDLSDLAPIEVPVRLGQKRFVLVEASHAAAKRWKSASLAGAEMSFDESGTRTLKRLQNVASNDALLVSLCLFELVKGQDGQDKRVPVTQAYIEALLDRQVKKLHDRCLEISPSLAGGDDLEALKRERDKLDDRLRKLEDASPKKLPSGGTES